MRRGLNTEIIYDANLACNQHFQGKIQDNEAFEGKSE